MKIKKVLPLVMSLLMAGGAFAGVAGCNNGNSSGKSHTEHKYENWTSDGAGTNTHTGTCTAEGKCDAPTKTEGHEYTDVLDATCNKCGETRVIDHEHTWSSAYTYENEDGHYKMTNCTGHTEQVKGKVYAHKYDAEYKCTECGYKHEHQWTDGTIYKNSSGHYVATTCLSHRIIKKDVSQHLFDNDEDTTCSGCSYVRVPAHQHTYGDELINAQEKGHYKMAACDGHTDQKSDYYDHVFASGSNTCACGYTRGADTSTALASTATIYVVGDSTVCSYAKDAIPSNDYYYLPRYGYGTQLAQYLNVQESQIKNLALSGRSAKSFLTENNYKTLKSDIKSGDYLIIGFGHNDEKSDDSSRFSSATGGHTQSGTFQNVLYENYVKLAQDANATAILCTPITRYDASGNYTGSKVHVTADGDYAAAIKALGAATSTTVIDLTKLTSDLYKSDNAEAQYFHAHTSYDGDTVKTPTGRDDTHINKYGAETVCYLFATELKKTTNPLKAQVITNKLAPAKGTHLAAAVRADYTKADYEEFDPDNTAATKLTDDWYRTAMGNLGGNNVGAHTANYADGKFTVGDTSLKSKIDSNSDGFAAAFMQVDVRKNFTASATLTVKTVASGLTNSQGGCGMMLRDDIIINKNIANLSSNYVAAGVLNTKAPVFSRESGALTSGGSSAALKAGDTFEVSITRLGQVVTVKVGSVTKTYTDFDFVAVDGDYMYLCLFANRGVTAEFTNVQFEITGNAISA